MRGGVGLVRALVPRESDVTVDAEHRAALEVTADRAQPRPHLGDEAEKGLAHERLVASLMLPEPLTVVVLPELPQELEQLGGEPQLRPLHRASGSGRSWNFTTLLVVPLPPSTWKGALVLMVAHRPRPFQPVSGSSMRPSI